ncbi:hypothetical protein NX059_012050 [Plenodomus lindquistii]|nr:hypothetical protein NX059_012050 [Plenodomus lindquistii]
MAISRGCVVGLAPEANNANYGFQFEDPETLALNNFRHEVEEICKEQPTAIENPVLAISKASEASTLKS